MALEEIARIDATKRSVMDELSGTFNPLHVNIDKTEARELMAKSKGERPKAGFNWIEFSALAGSFLALLLVILLFLREKPTDAVLKSAEALVSSTNPSDWSTAREILGGVLKRQLSDVDRKEANRMFLTAQRQTLRNWGERQIRNGLQSKAVQNFVEAYGDEQSHRFQTAYRKYEGLARNLGESSSEPEVYYEALAGTDRLKRLHELPDGDDGINDWLELHRDADSPEKLESCIAIGQDLLKQLGNSPDQAAMRDRATALVDQWNQRLASIRAEEE
jgi:hypothetical protein